jgi:hypothetical protein
MTNPMKIVDFALCKSCKYYKTKEEDEPCRTCLTHSDNLYSTRPINYIKEDK